MTTSPEEKGDSAKGLVGIVAKYSASRFYRQFWGLLTAFLRPKLLSPADFGLWNLLRIIPDYVSYGALGLNSAMRLNVPRERAAGNQEAVTELEDTAWTGVLCSNGFFALVLVILGMSGHWGHKVSWGLIAMGFTFILLSVSEYKMNSLKAHEGFGILTATNFFHITLNSILTVVLLLAFGIYGLYIALPTAHLLTIWYMYRRDGHLPHLRFNFTRFKQMVTFGLPVMALGVIIMLVQTSDRLIIAMMLGNEELGYYGISNMIMGFLMNVPGAAREVLEPRLMRELEHHGIEKISNSYLFKPLFQTSYLMPMMVGPVVLCLPVAVSILLPRYTPGVTATQILSIGGYFFAHIIVLRGIIAARNLQLRAFKLVLLGLVWNVVWSMTAIAKGYGIVGVALCSLSSFLLIYLVLFWLMKRDLNLGQHPLWPAYRWRLCLPFPCMLGLLFALNLWPNPTGWYGVPVVGIKTALFLAVMFLFRHLIKKPTENKV